MVLPKDRWYDQGKKMNNNCAKLRLRNSVKKSTGWDLRKQNRTKEYLTQLGVSKQTSINLKRSLQLTNHQSCRHETKSSTTEATKRVEIHFNKSYLTLLSPIDFANWKKNTNSAYLYFYLVIGEGSGGGGGGKLEVSDSKECSISAWTASVTILAKHGLGPFVGVLFRVLQKLTGEFRGPVKLRYASDDDPVIFCCCLTVSMISSYISYDSLI